MCALGREILDHFQQMTNRARQAIEPYGDERVARALFLAPASRGSPSAGRAGAVFVRDHIAACGIQLYFLGLGRLLIGRDPRVADQATL